MKIKLPSLLKRALLVALFATSALSTTAWAQTTATAAANTITVSGSGTEATLPTWGLNNTIIFDATTDATTVVNYTGLLTNLAEINIAAGGGGILQATAGNTGDRYVTVPAAGLTINANEDFTFDLVNGFDSGGGQYARNFAVGSSSATFNIATDKTFTLIGDMVGDATGSFNIKGGGILAYTFSEPVADGTGAATQHDNGTAFNISEGATFDLSSNAASDMTTMLLAGRVSLTTGNMKLMTEAVSISNNMTITGTSNITGATDLTLTGTLLMDDAAALSFGESVVNLSGATFDLSQLGDGESFTLSYTGAGNITGLTVGSPTTGITGLDLNQTASWSFDDALDTWTLSVSGAAAQTLDWTGGDGTWAQGGAGWTTTGATPTAADFNSGDVIVLSGPGATLTVDGEVTIASLTVTGGDYMITTDSTTGEATDGITNLGAIVKSGAGTLTLSGDLGLAGNMNIQAGTVHIGSAGAVDGNQVQISAGATLSAGSYLGTVTLNSGAVYDRVSQGYTVIVGEGTVLKDNVKMRMTGVTTTIMGGGTYEIDSILLGNTSGASTALNINANTTLKIAGSALSNSGGNGSFMLSNYPNSTPNEVNVSGILDVNAGISLRDGSAIVNVNDGGEFIMRKGLAAVQNESGKTASITVASGGTLTLFNKDTTHTGDSKLNVLAITTTMASGSTLKAGNDVVEDNVTKISTTTVSDAITYAENASVTFEANVADNGVIYTLVQDLVLDHAINLGTGTATTAGGGRVTFTDQLTAANLEVSNQINIDSTANLRISNSIATGGMAIANAGNGAAIQLQANAGQTAYLDSYGIYNAQLTNATLTRKDDLFGASINNSTLTNSKIGEGTYTLAGTVVLDDTTLDENTVLTLGANTVLTLTGTSTVGIDQMAAANKGTTDITLTGGYEGSATLGGDGTLTDIDTLEGTQLSLPLYTLDVAAFADYASVTVQNSLTLNIDMTQDDYDAFLALFDANSGVAFDLAGMANTNLDLFYNNITINIDVNNTQVWSQAILGNDGSVYYIPEPSTATLSLLALAGLLGRRRRKS